MNLTFFLSAFSLICILILRKDFFTFIFLILFSFLFLYVPLYIICIDHELTSNALIIIDQALIFLIGFLLAYYIFILNKRVDSVSFFFCDSNDLTLATKNSLIIVIIGLIFKLVAGDLIHSSVFYIPWQFPLLYGIGDRIYYLGVLVTCLSVYRFGFCSKDKFVAIIVLILSVLGGSRVTLLIPIAFLMLLKIATNKLDRAIFLMIFSGLVLFFVVSLIGIFRISESHRDYSFDVLVETFIFRISEFSWPAELIKKLNSQTIAFDFGWFYSSFLGIFPAFLGEFLMGQNVFSRDTNIMFNSGFGHLTMSVPLTVIGEGYYWSGSLGVFFIGILYSIGFNLVYKFTKNLRPAIRTLLYLQLFKSVFVLPVAAFPEFISFCTKDIFVDLLLVIVILNFVRQYSRNKAFLS